MTSHTHAPAGGEAAAVQARSLQCACDCGAAAGVSGQCPSCATDDRLGVQPKLSINPPGDRWEREADRVADQVVANRPPALAGPLSLTPLVQRQPTAEDEEELQTKHSVKRQPVEDEGEDLQSKPVLQRRPAATGGAPVSSPRPTVHDSAQDDGTAPPVVHAVLRDKGQPLAAAARRALEPRFGYDFSGVRVHTGPKANKSCAAVGAQAYTVGHDVVFGSGRLAPDTQEGARLLAHELAHVVQQGAAPPLRRGREPATAGAGVGVPSSLVRKPLVPGAYALRLLLPSGEKVLSPIEDKDDTQAVGADAAQASAQDRTAPTGASLGSGIGRRLQRAVSFTNPTPTPRDPLARVATGDPPGLTVPTINGSAISNTPQILGQITPTRVNTAASGGSTTCEFDPSLTIDTSANVTVASNAGPTGWTGNVAPAVIGNPPACSGASGTIPAVMVATPSNADFVARVRANEQEHVDAIRELHDRHLVPYDRFVTGLRGRGPTPTDCGNDLVTQLGHQHTQAAFGFTLGYAAETERLDGPGGTHKDTATVTVAAGCTSVTLTLGQANATIAGASRGNVVPVSPTVTSYDLFRLSVSGSNVVESPAAGGGGGSPRVIHGFSSAANARVGLHVFQHYGTTSKNVIGNMTYLLVGSAAPAGSGAALNGVTEESIDPARFQVTLGVPNPTDWAITQMDGNNIRTIVNFAGDRDEAFSAVDVLRSLGVTKLGFIGPRAAPELMFFRL